jgi:hypothetical protein
MLLIADVGSSWSEGFGARNVIVRNNQFESENCLGTGDGAVIGIGADDNGEVTHYPLLQDILFEDNVFKEMPGPAIEATSFKNLIFRNNEVINIEKAPVVLQMRGAVRAELGSGLSVESNSWTTQKGIPAPGLFYDPQTTSQVACQGNRLKN